MKIGIDISQMVYSGTGVARYVEELVEALLMMDDTHEYVLFAATLRKADVIREFAKRFEQKDNVSLKLVPIPPTVLEFLWNRLHIMPIESFIGEVDVFWSSDWTQPPLRSARGVTTIHDLAVLRYPESFNMTIVAVHKRRLKHVVRECQMILCDSEATKTDISELLNVPDTKLAVVYPGYESMFDG